MGYAHRRATVTRLAIAKERVQEEQASELRQLVLDLDLPHGLESELIGLVDRRTASRNGWTFVMVSPEAFGAVHEWLLEHSTKPKAATRLWVKIFQHLRHDTAEITITRSDLANEIGISPRDVSRIMSELATINAILRERDGRGVRYLLNPHVGTMLQGAQRDVAQRYAGPLQLVN